MNGGRDLVFITVNAVHESSRLYINHIVHMVLIQIGTPFL